MKIEIGYATDVFPTSVAMVITATPGQTAQSLDYGYQELENSDPNITQLDVLSSWLASGAGGGLFKVVEGNYEGATHVECMFHVLPITCSTASRSPIPRRVDHLRRR